MNADNGGARGEAAGDPRFLGPPPGLGAEEATGARRRVPLNKAVGAGRPRRRHGFEHTQINPPPHNPPPQGHPQEVRRPFGNNYNVAREAMGPLVNELFAGNGGHAENYAGQRRRECLSEPPAPDYRAYPHHQPGNPQMAFNNQAPNLGYNRPDYGVNPPMHGNNPPPQLGNNPQIVLAHYVPLGYMVLPPMMGMGFGNVVPIAVPVYQANDAPVNMGPIIPQRFENNMQRFEERGAQGGVPNAAPNPPAQRQCGIPQSCEMAGYPAGRNLGNQMRRNDVMAAAEEMLILEQRPEDAAPAPSSDLASAFKY